MKKKLMILFTMLPFILIINGCTEIIPSFEIATGQDTIEINSEYTDLGAVFKDGAFTETIFSQDTLDTSVLGLNELSYEYAYEEQNYSVTRYVIVVDQLAPDIQLNPGVDTVIVGSNWVDQGVTVTDNSLEQIAPVITGIVNTQVAGAYEVIYTATDSSGNVNSITRFVIVISST